MNLGELLLLCASALVVSAASVIGIATATGRSSRVPTALQSAIVPSGGHHGRWWKRGYLAIAVAFLVLGQGVLLVSLLLGSIDLLGAVLVVTEFALIVLLVLYFARPAEG
jgi:hypothetical protein